MAHKVKCFFCGEQFDRDIEPCVKVNDRRYAHIKCVKEQGNPELLKEEKEKQNFYKLVKSIYGSNYNFLMINKQATNYINQYGYTWSGMTKCLQWFYNIKHGSLEEGHGGIGIIPYIYDQVRDYYYKLYLTEQENKNKKIQIPIINITIPSPQSLHQPPRLMNLDE